MVWSVRTDDGVRMRTLWKGRGEGVHARTVRDAEPAVHAELAANCIIECASGRAPRSTAAAWDKRETIAW